MRVALQLHSRTSLDKLSRMPDHALECSQRVILSQFVLNQHLAIALQVFNADALAALRAALSSPAPCLVRHSESNFITGFAC